jgi:hypothetical protein
MQRDTFLALLALDAYSRNLDPRQQEIAGLGGIGSFVGNAQIKYLSNFISPDFLGASFSGVAYEWQGGTVISYRARVARIKQSEEM